MRKNITLSFIDQGLVSAFNFALNLVLIKWWAPEEFGLFSLIFAISFVLMSLQNALINTPYAVLVPASEHPHALRHTLSHANLYFVLVITVILGMLLTFITPLSSQISAISIAAFIGTRLLREYLRSRWSSELEFKPVLKVDVAFSLLMLVTVAGLSLNNANTLINLETLLWVLTACQLLSVLTLLNLERKLLVSLPLKLSIPGYAAIWEQSRWSLVGVTTTELQNRGYVFVVGAVFGPASLGLIQAARVFFGPLSIIAGAWTRVAKPTLARLFSKQQYDEFTKSLIQAGIAFTLFNLVLALALYLLWPWLKSTFFNSAYEQIGFVVAQWALVTLFFQLRATTSVGLQAQNRFKELAMATVWGAGAAMTSLGILSLLGNDSWVVMSVFVGESVALLYLIKLLRQFAPQRIDGVSEDV